MVPRPVSPLAPTLGGAPAARACRLPSGLRVHYVSRGDVRFLYKEIFEEQVHLRHGVRLAPGDVVLDAGANIGLFSIFAAERVGPEGVVVACEPLPATFAVLEANLASHRQWCSERGVQPGRVVAIEAGLGDGSRESATFTLYEGAAGWGTMHPDEGEVMQDMERMLENALSPSSGPETCSVLSAPARLLGTALRRWAPRPVYNAVWRWVVRRMLASGVQHECPLTSVSSLMREQDLARVDLLKVDVERAELEVLQGVAPADWPRVRQVVAEVHGPNLEAVLGLLLWPGGFERLVVEQTQDLAGTSLHNVFCWREDAERA